MSPFGRRSSTPATPVPELPPTLSAADLAAAANVMDRWDAAQGNSDAMWDCVDAVAKLGGFRGEAAVFEETARGMDPLDVLNRPWRWWAEAAMLANAHGQHALAGRIFLFTYQFQSDVLPTMNAFEQSGTGLLAPTRGTYESMAASAADSIARLPRDVIVINNRTVRMPADAVLLAAKSILSKAR